MIPVIQPRFRVVDRWLPGWNIFTYVIPKAKSARASVCPQYNSQKPPIRGELATLYRVLGGLKWSEWSLRYQGYRGYIC